jgi:class 3 adenylate cyclase
MSFLDTVRGAKNYLEEQGRVSLTALKLEFDLDDTRLESLIEELVDVQQVAAREGKVLSWIGAASTEATAEKPPTQGAPMAERDAPAEAERRQLTVMFCDLVGSTALSERLDAEALSEVVTAYQKTCAAGVQSFDGHIAQYLGDGVLVYFGYPLAHEDDAMRAIHAALRIAEEIPGLNSRLVEEHAALREHPLQVRVGIHTGPVVVGELGVGEKRERLALGDTVNIAARVEREAEPGSIVVSDATRRLVRGAFIFEALGERSLKGIEGPVALFRPVQATGVQSRLALAGASGLTPLVGREQQVGMLLESWESAKAGHGQVVLLSGEAGIGKSRMIEVLRQHVADEPHSWHEYRGSAYHQNSAFYPIIEFIERVLLFTETDARGAGGEADARARLLGLSHRRDRPVDRRVPRSSYTRGPVTAGTEPGGAPQDGHRCHLHVAHHAGPPPTLDHDR